MIRKPNLTPTPLDTITRITTEMRALGRRHVPLSDIDWVRHGACSGESLGFGRRLSSRFRGVGHRWREAISATTYP
jgi:hypothetical protein